MFLKRFKANTVFFFKCIILFGLAYSILTARLHIVSKTRTGVPPVHVPDMGSAEPARTNSDPAVHAGMNKVEELLHEMINHQRDTENLLRDSALRESALHHDKQLSTSQPQIFEHYPVDGLNVAPIRMLLKDLGKKYVDDLKRNCDLEYYGYNGSDACPCMPIMLRGPHRINFTVPSWSYLEQRYQNLLPGGEWFPSECIARQKVAVIVPYRDRELHLKVFLRNLHSVLQTQQAHYRIFVVELPPSILFNRALAMNIGFLEALRLFEADCYIFHDVDLLTQDDRLLYRCKEGKPIHLCEYIDKWQYGQLNGRMFGGAVAISRMDFENVNGYSNLFYGWGGEDDELIHRFMKRRIQVERPPFIVSRYHAAKHLTETSNAVNSFRYGFMKHWISLIQKEPFKEDGISTLKLNVTKREDKKTHTHIYANIVSALDAFQHVTDFHPTSWENTTASILNDMPVSIVHCAGMCRDNSQCNAFIYSMDKEINQCNLLTTWKSQPTQQQNIKKLFHTRIVGA